MCERLLGTTWAKLNVVHVALIEAAYQRPEVGACVSCQTHNLKTRLKLERVLLIQKCYTVLKLP